MANFKPFPVQLYPKCGAIKDYIDYVDPTTEAPKHFHFFVAASLISAVLGRRIYLPWGTRNLFPNTYVTVIGDSTVTRKTTSLNAGKTFLSELERDASARILHSNSGSPEGLFDELSARPNGIFIYSEFKSLLELCEKGYAEDLKSTLTDWYDCPDYVVRTLRGREIIIDNLCFSILAGTTMEWFEKSLKEGDLFSGFLSRFIFVPGDDTGQAIPRPPAGDVALHKKVYDALRNLHAIEPAREMSLSTDAVHLYDDWYKDIRLTKEEDERIKSFKTRITDYAIKFAMILTVAEQQGHAVISSGNMQSSIELMDWLISNIKSVVGELTFTKFGELKKKVLKHIQKNPGLLRKELLQKTHLKSWELNDVVITLQEEEVIREEETSRQKGGGRMATRYYPIKVARVA